MNQVSYFAEHTNVIGKTDQLRGDNYANALPIYKLVILSRHIKAYVFVHRTKTITQYRQTQQGDAEALLANEKQKHCFA